MRACPRFKRRAEARVVDDPRIGNLLGAIFTIDEGIGLRFRRRERDSRLRWYQKDVRRKEEDLKGKRKLFPFSLEQTRQILLEFLRDALLGHETLDSTLKDFSNFSV